MPLLRQRAGPAASHETDRPGHRGHKAFPKKNTKARPPSQGFPEKDIDKITLEDFAEKLIGGKQSADSRTHCKEPARQPLILKAKIIELTILIIGGVGSYEDRLAALMPDIAGELTRMIVDISASCVINGDHSVIHD